jgi:sugar (pentulose or hexulose) kinase
MESVAYRLAAVYDALGPLCAAGHRIIVSGGAVLSMPSWLQIIADTLGYPLTALASDDETTARGAALMAATEAGILPNLEAADDFTANATVYQPDMAAHDRYRAGRARQERLENALVPTGEFV